MKKIIVLVSVVALLLASLSGCKKSRQIQMLALLF